MLSTELSEDLDGILTTVLNKSTRNNFKSLSNGLDGELLETTNRLGETVEGLTRRRETRKQQQYEMMYLGNLIRKIITVRLIMDKVFDLEYSGSLLNEW
jgi:hypothetical protein